VLVVQHYPPSKSFEHIGVLYISSKINLAYIFFLC
jgi:hypothetical protein